MENEVSKYLELARPRHILKPIGAVVFDDGELIKVGKMFDRFRRSAVWNGKDKESAGLKHFEGILKRSTNRRNDVLEDFGRNYEIT